MTSKPKTPIIILSKPVRLLWIPLSLFSPSPSVFYWCWIIRRGNFLHVVQPRLCIIFWSNNSPMADHINTDIDSTGLVVGQYIYKEGKEGQAFLTITFFRFSKKRSESAMAHEREILRRIDSIHTIHWRSCCQSIYI